MSSGWRVEAERLALPPVHLARPPLQTIANVGFPELLRRGDADSRVRQAVGGEEENRVAGKDFAACLVDLDELATLRESASLSVEPDQAAGLPPSYTASAPLDGQALAALAAAARENCLAVLGPHPDQEAVRALATAVVRLKSTLRCH